jgi:hypothetical protein
MLSHLSWMYLVLGRRPVSEGLVDILDTASSLTRMFDLPYLPTTRLRILLASQSLALRYCTLLALCYYAVKRRSQHPQDDQPVTVHFVSYFNEAGPPRGHRGLDLISAALL